MTFLRKSLLSQEVRQQRRALTLAWAAAGSLFLLAGVSAWQWKSALHAEQTAVEQRGIAEHNAAQAKEQRDKALRTQSQFLATVSTQHLAAGDAASAILIAVEGLNDQKFSSPSAKRKTL